MQGNSQEASVIRTYLDTCLDLPWDKSTPENIDINKAEAILNRDHYGLKKVKERILEILAVRKLSDSVKSQIICLWAPRRGQDLDRQFHRPLPGAQIRPRLAGRRAG